MIRRRDTIDAAEQGFVELYNTMPATTIPKGGACIWDYVAGVARPGASVTQPAAGLLALFAGLADEDILPATWGRVLVRGYLSYALVINDTVNAIAIGDVLIPVAGQFYLARSGAGTAAPSLVQSADTYAANAVQTVATKKIHLPFR